MPFLSFIMHFIDYIAQYGMYTAFAGPFIYTFVGFGESSYRRSDGSDGSYEYVQKGGPGYAIFLSFLAGCVELFAGLLNLGKNQNKKKNSRAQLLIYIRFSRFRHELYIRTRYLRFLFSSRYDCYIFTNKNSLWSEISRFGFYNSYFRYFYQLEDD